MHSGAGLRGVPLSRLHLHGPSQLARDTARGDPDRDRLRWRPCHLGSRADLLPLGILGFGLCLLYRYTGSLYPGMLAHSLNNSIAFAGLAGWSWYGAIPLIVGAPAAILLAIAACNRAGLFNGATGIPRPAA